MSESAATKDLLTLLVYWISIYISAWLAEKTHLSPLVFYLVIGSILGHLNEIDGVHVVRHSPTIHFVAELGITLVFFALGLEETVDNFMNGIKKAWGIASIGAAVPFSCGFCCSLIFFPDTDMSGHTMVGLAVTATAVSLTMISLKSEGLAMSRAAIGIMTSAVLDDVACLALVAIMVPIASGEAEPTAGGICWVVGKSLIFFAIITTLNMFVFPTIRNEKDAEKHPFLAKVPGLRAVGVTPFIQFLEGEQATLATLGIGLSIGLLATAFGFHPAIGAYMAGLIMEEGYFDVELIEEGEGEFEEQDGEDAGDGQAAGAGRRSVQTFNTFQHVKDTLESAAFNWIGPVFFLNLGSQIIVKPSLIAETVGPMLGFYVSLFVGQVLSAAVAARFVPGGFTWTESWLIGFGMLGRAELFFVVLNVAYLEHPIITEPMFFSLTMAAMLLNVSVPVTISLYKPYYMRNNKPPAEAKLKQGTTISMDLFKMVHSKATKDHTQLQRRVFNARTYAEDDFQVASERRQGATPNTNGAVVVRSANRATTAACTSRNADTARTAERAATFVRSNNRCHSTMSNRAATKTMWTDIEFIREEVAAQPPVPTAWGHGRAATDDASSYQPHGG